MAWIAWVIPVMISTIVVLIGLMVWSVRMGTSILRHPSSLLGLILAGVALGLASDALGYTVRNGADETLVNVSGIMANGLAAIALVQAVASLIACIKTRRWLSSRRGG